MIVLMKIFTSVMLTAGVFWILAMVNQADDWAKFWATVALLSALGMFLTGIWW